MRNRHILLTLIFLLTGSLTLTGQKKTFTADDYLNRDLRPESIQGLAWRGDMNAFTCIVKNNLIQNDVTDPSAGKTIMSLSDLNKRLKSMDQMELKRFPSVKWMDNNNFYFRDHNKLYRYDMIDSSLVKANEFDEKGDNINIDDYSLNVAYTIGNNLFVSSGSKTIQVTEEKNPNIVYGQIPSRNEFGIDAGSFWSPDGKLLAFYKNDQSEVTDYPLVDIFHRIAQEAPVKYPMAGMKSQKIQLGIFNTNINEIVYLQTTGPENQYLTSVTWDPSGRFIYVGILNRDQNHLLVNKYDAKSGEQLKTLFEEKNDRYVEPLNSLYFLKSDPSEFIWQSRRDGWNHLYLYNTDGKLIRQITHGDWEVTRLLACDQKGNAVFYESTMKSPLERHLYKTDIKSSNTVRITRGEGVHRTMASKNMDFYIDTYSGINMARAYYLLDSKGNRMAVLNEDIDPYKDYNTGVMSIFKIKADDGATDLYCRLIKPVDFDPAKKYPVIIYVYGGPHVQLIDKSWTGGAGFWLNFLAQRGYLVFSLDNRGSSGRGFAFESIIHRQLGKTEMEDQMAGVRYLKSLDYVDTARIGVNGWSFGGFMTISLMLHHPGVFKVACAGGPVIDWKWYEVMYGERYMDTPMENPEGYKETSLMNYAGDLKGRLMIIHGTNDNTVVWQNSLSFIDECIKQGRQVDYFVYPGALHNMVGKARVHLFNKMAGYYDDFLK
jgi:dipeptidyl-peptidase 4